MYYVVVKQPVQYHQMTLEEFLFGNPTSCVINSSETNTRTYEVQNISDKFKRIVNVDYVIDLLKAFNTRTEELRSKDRHSLYREFYIPKRSHGFRKIDAPNAELMEALRSLKVIFEENCKIMYHTSAFAYIKGRCTIDAVKRHQANKSRWFAKYDLSNFFGSTTLDFVMEMFSMIYPFCEIIRREDGKQELMKALELAFLDGGLPQGTPISPLITNIMMIPVDYKLYNSFRNFHYVGKDGKDTRNYCVYTRYADDFLVSSEYDFDFRAAERHIKEVLASFNAPFTIKAEKTRYGSSSGSNYNLGVLLTKENKITIGRKRKKQFMAMLSSFVLDTVNGTPWEKEDVMVLDGHRNYYSMVEGDVIDKIIEHVGEKYNVNIKKMIKEQLRN